MLGYFFLNRSVERNDDLPIFRSCSYFDDMCFTISVAPESQNAEDH